MRHKVFPTLGEASSLSNEAIEDRKLCFHAQCIVHLHSQTPLCTAWLTAEGCQSQGGNADGHSWSTEALPLSALQFASHWSLDCKPRRTPHMPCYVKMTSSTKPEVWYYTNNARLQVEHSNMLSRGWHVNTRAQPECWHFNWGTTYLNVPRATMLHLFCRMTNYEE